ncbi:hypothetical protein [Bacillus sp. LL01]|uniref:hypothetical protein n=1 Tax=Bacillus sp. LL01 TaxID=1665556 RepID=UPI000FFF2479|nr:hypothetical protein [Bacillus sp. LL01]
MRLSDKVLDGSDNFYWVFGHLNLGFGQLCKNFGQVNEIFGQESKNFGHLPKQAIPATIQHQFHLVNLCQIAKQLVYKNQPLQTGVDLSLSNY